MSQEYKDKIDKLCEQADRGNIEFMQELIDECKYWNKKNKEVINKYKKNK